MIIIPFRTNFQLYFHGEIFTIQNKKLFEKRVFLQLTDL